MGWLQHVSIALLFIACGGKAAPTPKGSPNVGGAAGEPSAAAGASSVEVAGEGGSAAGASGGGAAGASVGGVGGVGGAADAAGAAGAEPSAAGAGGQAVLVCAGLDCLAGAELVYVPDRAWQRPAAPVSITNELSEADYQPLLGPTWLATFSSDAASVDLTPVAGGATVHGTRDQQREGRAWFELGLFAGGRFVVQASSAELHAEYTNYGSGTPIVASTRGLLETP
ncbi:MAG TPA: hypothetical protein VIK01_27735 [Polyangiaceae bacterium]